MDEKDRRRQPRVDWRGEVRLVLPEGAMLDAKIADISETGCGFQTCDAIEIGAPIGIDGNGFHGAGVIRYCYPHHGGYRVGVELTMPQ